MWVCPYWCIWVRVGSGSRSLAVSNHMFVQSEQGGYEYCWIWFRLIKVWMAKWWRVVSLATMYQFLCMMAVSCLPISEKGVLMGRMFVSVWGVR